VGNTTFKQGDAPDPRGGTSKVGKKSELQQKRGGQLPSTDQSARLVLSDWGRHESQQGRALGQCKNVPVCPQLGRLVAKNRHRKKRGPRGGDLGERASHQRSTPAGDTWSHLRSDYPVGDLVTAYLKGLFQSNQNNKPS